MARLPAITDAEWKLLEPLLPSRSHAGKPRLPDRPFLSALFYCEATGCSVDCLPNGYPNPRSIRTRRKTWERDGTLDRLMAAGAPAIARMKRTYWGLIRGASDIDSPDWRSSSEFFGRGAIPRLPRSEARGRYADRRR
jgi:putative transposase